MLSSYACYYAYLLLMCYKIFSKAFLISNYENNKLFLPVFTYYIMLSLYNYVKFAIYYEFLQS